MPFMTRAQVLGSACALVLTTRAGVCFAAAPSAKPDPADIKALGVALALERSVIAAYSDPALTHFLSAPVLAVINQFLADHQAHQAALEQAITATGQAAPQDLADVNRPALANEGDVLGFAYTLERSLANTQLTAVPDFKNRDYATTAASILGVETTHVALLGEALRQGRAYPGGFVTS
jgi:hypothetical protein